MVTSGSGDYEISGCNTMDNPNSIGCKTDQTKRSALLVYAYIRSKMKNIKLEDIPENIIHLVVTWYGWNTELPLEEAAELEELETFLNRC